MTKAWKQHFIEIDKNEDKFHLQKHENVSLLRMRFQR